MDCNLPDKENQKIKCVWGLVSATRDNTPVPGESNSTFIPDKNVVVAPISKTFDNLIIKINPNTFHSYVLKNTVPRYKEQDVEMYGYNYMVLEYFDTDDILQKVKTIALDIKSITFNEINYIFKLRYNTTNINHTIDLVDVPDPISGKSEDIPDAFIWETNYNHEIIKQNTVNADRGILSEHGFHIADKDEVTNNLNQIQIEALNTHPITLVKPIVFNNNSDWCIVLNCGVGTNNKYTKSVILGDSTKGEDGQIFSINMPKDTPDYSFHFGKDQPFINTNRNNEKLRLTFWTKLEELKDNNRENYLTSIDESVSCIIYHVANDADINIAIRVSGTSSSPIEPIIAIFSVPTFDFKIDSIGGYSNGDIQYKMNGIIRHLYLCPQGINSIRDEMKLPENNRNRPNMMKILNKISTSANLNLVSLDDQSNNA